MFHYPLLLTRGFQAYNVNFLDEYSEMTGRSQIITFDTFNNCEYS